MKIVTVLGARPQFIKAAALSRIFIENSRINEVIIHTGQHYDEKMSEIFFNEMQIPRPSYSLNISSKYHGEMTGKMLVEIEKILLNEKPDIVIVYGDTNSTLAGALAASKLHIRIAHVEAGLRSYNRKMPEEVNRVITDHLATWLFCPTGSSVENLIHEGIAKDKIYRVGDIMFDTVLYYKPMSEKRSQIISALSINGKEFILATIHRAENTNDPERLNVIFEQLENLSRDKLIVLPLHPRTKSYLKKNFSNPNLLIIDPVGYFDMIQLQSNCKLIITDSGGVQKEAFFNNKFCITVREETEWIELVENGFNYLAKPLNSISNLVNAIWDKKFDANGMRFYGEGQTAKEILEILTRGNSFSNSI